MDLKTDLKKTRGLGSAHEGTDHWQAQRLSALALLLLGPWFVIAFFFNLGSIEKIAVLGWIEQPFNAFGLLLFLGAGLYHGHLGVRVIIEDYIHHPALKMTSLVSALAVFLGAGMGVFFALAFILFSRMGASAGL